jgi:hypothetical protein
MFSFFVSSSALKKLVGAGKTFLAFMVILGQAAGLDGHVLSVGLEKIPTPHALPSSWPSIMTMTTALADSCGQSYRAQTTADEIVQEDDTDHNDRDCARRVYINGANVDV